MKLLLLGQTTKLGFKENRVEHRMPTGLSFPEGSKETSVRPGTSIAWSNDGYEYLQDMLSANPTTQGENFTTIKFSHLLMVLTWAYVLHDCEPSCMQESWILTPCLLLQAPDSRAQQMLG